MQDILIKAGCFVAIIILGYTIKKIGVLHQDDFMVLSKIVIRITTPAAIAVSFAGKEIDLSLLLLILLGFGSGIVLVLAAYILGAGSSKNRHPLSHRFLSANHRKRQCISGNVHVGRRVQSVGRLQADRHHRKGTCHSIRSVRTHGCSRLFPVALRFGSPSDAGNFVLQSDLCHRARLYRGYGRRCRSVQCHQFHFHYLQHRDHCYPAVCNAVRRIL